MNYTVYLATSGSFVKADVVGHQEDDRSSESTVYGETGSNYPYSSSSSSAPSS